MSFYVHAHSFLSSVFPLEQCCEKTLSPWWIQVTDKSPHRHARTHTHAATHTQPHVTLRLTHHQWHFINSSGAKMKRPALFKRHFVKQMTLPERNAMLFINLALNLYFRKKITGDNKHRRNPSHEICLEASIWTGCGQRHHSWKPLLFGSHLHEWKFFHIWFWKIKDFFFLLFVDCPRSQILFNIVFTVLIKWFGYSDSCSGYSYSAWMINVVVNLASRN